MKEDAPCCQAIRSPTASPFEIVQLGYYDGTTEFREHRPRPPRPGVAGDGWITQGDPGDSGEDCFYSPMPLIGFAVSLQRGARMSGIRHLGGIRLVPELRSAVRVEAQFGSRSAVVPEEELRQAADDFARKVKPFFLDRVPQIERHPKWHEWFPEEVPG
jgi:hypothetical protein